MAARAKSTGRRNTKDYLEAWRVRPVRGWGCAALAGPGFIADQGAFVPLPGVSEREGVMVPSGSPSSPAEQLERALLEDERVRRAVVRARAAGGFTALVELDFELTSVWAHGQGLEFSTYRSLAEHPRVVAIVNELVAPAAVDSGIDAQAVCERISPRRLTVAAGDLTPDRQVDVERLTEDTV